jgi:hypothetical protein
MVLPPLFYVLTLVHMLPYTAFRWEIPVAMWNTSESCSQYTPCYIQEEYRLHVLAKIKQLQTTPSTDFFLAVSLASTNYSVHQYTQVSTFSPHKYISHHIFLMCVFFTYYRISNRIRTSQASPAALAPFWHSSDLTAIFVYVCHVQEFHI